MARSQLLILLVAVLAYYATAQTCASSEGQLTIAPYSPTGANGYRNELMTPLTLNATVRYPYYTNYTWVVTQIPAGLSYSVFPDKMGILVTGTPTQAGSFTMNVVLFFYDLNAGKQKCTTQPIYFNILCRTPFTLDPLPSAGVHETAYSSAVTAFKITGGSGSGYTFTANYQLDYAQYGVNLTTGGAFVGTWSIPKTFTFYVNVIDDGMCSDSFEYTVTVACPTLTIAPNSGELPDGLTTDYYNTSLTTSGGRAPYDYYSAEISLPSGFNFAADGTVYGTPAAASSSNFFINVEDVNKCAGSGTFSLAINCPTITMGGINGSTLVDHDYSSTVVASGGSAPYTYVIQQVGAKRSVGALPIGLNLATTTGVISGQPTAIGTYQFTVLATDVKGCTKSATYTIQVSCDDLTIGDISTTGIAASFYSAQLSTTLGSTGTYSYSTQDTLVKDLTLTTQGALQGLLKKTGIFTFTVLSTDSRTCTASREFTFNITCPTLTLSNMIASEAQASKSYSANAVCADGVGPYRVVDVEGLPSGLTSSNFNFFGIPNVIGEFNVTIVAADSNDCMNTFYMPLNVTCAPFAFSPVSSSATVDTSYTGQKFVVGSGFTEAVTFALFNGTLPRGLTLGPDGTLSGTPSLSGDFTFTVQATDVNGCTGEYTQEISVDCEASTLSVNPTLESGQTGVFYTDSFTATGSSHLPYNYTIAPASSVGVQLPYGVRKQVPKVDLQGWTLCYEGTYDTPLAGGEWNTIFSCLEGSQASYAMLACGNNPDTLYNAAAGPVENVFGFFGMGEVDSTSNGVRWYFLENNFGAAWGFADAGDSVELDEDVQCDGAEGDTRTCWIANMSEEEASGGYRCGDAMGLNGADWSRYIYVATEIPTIPLDNEETYTMMSNGTIYGLPTISGDLGFVVTVTDDAGCPASSSGFLHIDCGVFYVEDLPASQVTIMYSQSLNISGGSGSYSALITGLPQGLSYDDETNVLSGTPVSHGEYPIVIAVSDKINPCTYSIHVTFVVLCPPNNMSDIPPIAKVGTTYLTSISFINMDRPVHFEADSLLPYGLTLYADGTIEGVPSLPGDYKFFIRLVQDRPNGCSDGRWYSISVVCGPVDVTDISNNFILGDTVDESFDSSNGIQHYTYAVSSGQLPDGLTLDSDGHLNGTVTKAGFFRFSVRATDTYDCVGVRRFVVAVTCINPMALGPLPMSFMSREEVSMAPAILGGVAPYTFQLLLGTLPHGLELSSDGTIAGNVTSVGTFVFQLGVRDSQGCVATELYTVMVVAPPTSQPPVVNAPVATGNAEPTPTPVAAPVASPVEQVPTAPQVQAPVQPPVQAPVDSPGAVSGQSSVHCAISFILSVCLIVLISM